MNDKCRIYWNYLFSTIMPITHTNFIVLLVIEKRAMFVIKFSTPADMKITAKKKERKERYRHLIRDCRQLYQKYSVAMAILIIGNLCGAKSSLVRFLKIIPACISVKTWVCCGQMQGVVILGSVCVLTTHGTLLLRSRYNIDIKIYKAKLL